MSYPMGERKKKSIGQDEEDEKEEEMIFCPNCSLPMVERFRTVPCFHVVCPSCASRTSTPSFTNRITLDQNSQEEMQTLQEKDKKHLLAPSCPVCEELIVGLESLHVNDRLYMCYHRAGCLSSARQAPRNPPSCNSSSSHNGREDICRKVFVSKKSLRYHELLDHGLRHPSFDLFLSSLNAPPPLPPTTAGHRSAATPSSFSSLSVDERNRHEKTAEGVVKKKESFPHERSHDAFMREREEEEEEKNRQKLLNLFLSGQVTRHLSSDAPDSSLSFSLDSLLSKAKEQARDNRMEDVSYPWKEKEATEREVGLPPSSVYKSSAELSMKERGREEAEEEMVKNREDLHLQSQASSSLLLSHQARSNFSSSSSSFNSNPGSVSHATDKPRQAEVEEKDMKKRKEEEDENRTFLAKLGPSSTNGGVHTLKPSSSLPVEDEEDENLDDLM
ncbi:hypothetical protein CSUI_009327 [Cystoisospora suis]|uniref:Uncharacterized protein n=1 Tax=Cystoisospora suis TaxID=483139 RepID=A0A2C6KKB1_9APIC|nr:hypothetical protein CSUI_009327 [Cystoisospora suis]